MFNFLFLLFLNTKNPIVIIPGLYGSALKATYDETFKKRWFCPSRMQETLFWVDYKYFVPPFFDCTMYLLRGYYNSTSDTVTSYPNINIDVIDFGGDKGMSFIDTNGIFGSRSFDSFNSFFQYFKNKGYIVKKNIFGAPYDWRISILGIEETYYPKLKDLIEQAYEKNDGLKVILVTYSMGGPISARFLSKFVDDSWKEKYIKKVIMIGPSVGGASTSVETAWKQVFPYIPSVKTRSTIESTASSPGLHSHLPNYHIFGNRTIIRTSSGENITASQIPKFLIDNKKVYGNSIPLLKKNQLIYGEIPQGPGVETVVIYNSNISTKLTLDFSNGMHRDPSFEYVSGDGTIPTFAIDWICENWKSKYNIKCHDLENSGENFIHSFLSKNPIVHETVYNYTISDHINNSI